MLNIIKITFYVAIAFLLSRLGPWWIITIVSTFIGFFAPSLKRALFEGAFSVTAAWLIMLIINLFIRQDIVIMVDKIKLFLGLNSIMLILITLLIPMLTGLISSLFGYELKKVVEYEK